MMMERPPAYALEPSQLPVNPDTLGRATEYAERTFRRFDRLGVATFSDILALGAHALLPNMAAQASPLMPLYVRHLEQAIRTATAWEWPEQRASPAELHWYYPNVGSIPLLTAVPDGQLRTFGKLPDYIRSTKASGDYELDGLVWGAKVRSLLARSSSFAWGESSLDVRRLFVVFYDQVIDPYLASEAPATISYRLPPPLPIREMQQIPLATWQFERYTAAGDKLIKLKRLVGLLREQGIHTLADAYQVDSLKADVISQRVFSGSQYFKTVPWQLLLEQVLVGYAGRPTALPRAPQG